MDSLNRMGRTVATASLSVLFGCTTGLVSSPLSTSNDGDPPSEGLVYHLRQSTIKVDATYRLTQCGVNPTFELRGLTISSGSTKDPQLGATFVIDTAELASGSKVTNAIINTSDGLIKDVSYDAVDKTGEIIKELAKIPVSVATARAGLQSAKVSLATGECNQRPLVS